MTWHRLDSPEHPAPRDGTIVWLGSCKHGWVMQAHWFNDEWFDYDAEVSMALREYKTDPTATGWDVAMGRVPTHWQPYVIPPPPKDEG